MRLGKCACKHIKGNKQKNKINYVDVKCIGGKVRNTQFKKWKKKKKEAYVKSNQ